MKCPACGFETTNPRVAFCPNCGSRLSNDPASPAASVSPTEPADENDVTKPAAAAGSEVSAADPNLAPIVKTGNWFGTLLILFLVPVALAVLAGLTDALWGKSDIGHLAANILVLLACCSDLILYFIFAFSKSVNPSKRNFFKASLLMLLLTCVIVTVLCFLFSANIASYTELDLMQQLENFTINI